MHKKIIAFLMALTACANMAVIGVSAEESKPAAETSVSGSASADSKKDEKKKNKEPNPNISAEYEKAPLFDTSKVHTINLIVDDAKWDEMVAAAEEKNYIDCDVEIDGELIKGCSIRTKGHASLRTVAKRHDDKNDHFSFKIEFDHNDNSTTYHGLDKLALNSMGNDHTAMKDYLSYNMMRDMGVKAPLCSYTMIQKNGEDFALYLAVEAIEDSFKVRNYGTDDIDMYKPDLTDKLDHAAQTQENMSTLLRIMNGSYYADLTENDRINPFDDFWGGKNGTTGFNEEFNTVADMRWAGSEAAAYEDIWSETIFECTDEDKSRFISSLDTLNNGKTAAEKQSVVDVDQVMRYAAVQSFVQNGDSLFGIHHHNFYVTDDNGKLSYVPWDYNMAFGSFEFRTAILDVIGDDLCLDTTPTRLNNVMSAEKDLINYPIDNVMLAGDNSQLPMIDSWLSTEDGKKQYHAVFDELVKKIENGDYDKMIDDAAAIIMPYVEKDLTFYSADQIKTGIDQLKMYVKYRGEAIRGQLDGTIPSTRDGQSEKPETLIEPDGLSFAATGDSAGSASCPPTSMLNPIIKAVLGDDPDYTAGHFSDIMLGYFMDNTSLYDRVPELMQVPQMRGVATNIIAKKFGVTNMFFADPSAHVGPPAGAGGAAGGPPAGAGQGTAGGLPAGVAQGSSSADVAANAAAGASEKPSDVSAETTSEAAASTEAATKKEG